MVNVGIMTTFRQPNWGSVLQAYALQKSIEQLGYSCEVIDYLYPNEFHFNKGKSPFIHKSSLKHKLCVAIGFRSKTKMELLNDFIKNKIKTSQVCTDMTSLRKLKRYDCYISGSDQIWNPNTMLGDMSYLLDYTEDNSLRISYASSFACNEIPQGLKSQYSMLLKRYSCLSVRESNGAKLISELTGQPCKVVLDPTLLLNKEYWTGLSKESAKLKLPRRYILFYMLAYTYSPDETMNRLLKDVQKKLNIPIISLSSLPKNFKGEVFHISKKKGIGIFEFLHLFNCASFVVTSSFHGTAFSLNFGKQFFCVEDGKSSSDDRIRTLIQNLHMEDYLIKTTEEIDVPQRMKPYNVELEQEKLSLLRKDSLAYLKSSLNKL